MKFSLFFVFIFDFGAWKGRQMQRHFCSQKDLKDVVGVGVRNSLRLAREAGAEIKIGRRRVYDTERIINYMRTAAETGQVLPTVSPGWKEV